MCAANMSVKCTFLSQIVIITMVDKHILTELCTNLCRNRVM